MAAATERARAGLLAAVEALVNEYVDDSIADDECLFVRDSTDTERLYDFGTWLYHRLRADECSPHGIERP